MTSCLSAGLWSLLLLASVACSSKSPSAEEQEDPRLDEVVYVGATTDEALERLIYAPLKNDDAQLLTIDSPSAGAELPSSPEPEFSWHFAESARSQPSPSRTPTRMAGVSFKRRVLTDLRHLFGPIAQAHAHGAPYNGSAFYLVFKDNAGHTPLRVFTPEPSYTPEADAFAGLAQAKQPITLHIVSATFDNNALIKDGGPFEGGSVTFSIE